ncbi:DUF1799 domain-containing protein [Methylobacterium sp. WL6]|uniref:DUF1799 domain-containing protein n=1 Tax=Methylobacterium sp. WL6 TaxID=2603901 RepID=UPI0011C85742|nr:DUF1799 domain-containing protein [Methylobacterium sp. WL6]TXN60899.1 hypothetical protein FV230_25070 [Methylobacterium sp. WL6]
MPGGDAPADTAIEVWDDHWHAFTIFRACRTQWRLVAIKLVLFHLGLDYPGVEVVMRRLLPHDADHNAVFADIMVMEAEALPILNEVSA